MIGITRAPSLAGQVEEALALLVAGFDTANARTKNALFRGLEGTDGRKEIYRGLITTLLRLVFLLYAEDRALMPVDDPVYANNYSVTALADRLQEERLRYPQAMDRRYGAWAQLLALCRMVFEGVSHGSMAMPPRRGDLFDPAEYPMTRLDVRGHIVGALARLLDLNQKRAAEEKLTADSSKSKPKRAPKPKAKKPNTKKNDSSLARDLGFRDFPGLGV